MKKILFPTDFSEVATNAFIHALEFAKIVNGELVLLHTFELPLYDAQYFPENYTILFESIQLSEFDMFKEEIAKLRSLAKDRNLDQIRMTHRLMDGNLLYNIKIAIKEEDIDFVVMGTPGEAGWETFFTGTNTGDVINTVDMPVLSVPLNSKFSKLETIGFTTRYRAKDKLALKEVLKIAKKANAKIKCLYVKTHSSDVSKETIKDFEESFSGEPIEFSILLNDDIQGTILDFIPSQCIDVMAMHTYKKNFFSELFNPSLTQKLSNSLVIPVLAMHG